MKRRITAGIMITVTILMTCAFTFEPVMALYNERESIEIVKPEIEKFEIERLTEFNDPNLENYTLYELEAQIDNLKNTQDKAHELAQSARALGWPETSDAIQMAGSEWANAQLAINAYRTQYNKKYEEAEQAKWEQKMQEYPYATIIWLYMKNLGWNDYVCAGIMGNLMTEVGGQTLNIQYWLYGQGYYGMCQWSKGYARIWGADLSTQCDFLRDTIKYELDTFGYAYSKGFNYNSFLNMTNERDAAKAFAKCYERCASSTYSIRENNAEKAYEYFVN